MAHFAELDENNVVIRVVAVSNDVTTIDGVEVEQRGIDHMDAMLPNSGTWIQTSYNGNIRSRYAGEGMIYHPALDAFSPPQPYPSWTLNEETMLWDPPTPDPTFTNPEEGVSHDWDEDNQEWLRREL